MLRHAVVPVVSVYAVFAAMVVQWWRHPMPRRSTGRAPRARVLRHLAVTAAGGYAAFLGIVAIFHQWVAGERVLASAAVGGAALAVLVTAGFSALVVVARPRPYRS